MDANVSSLDAAARSHLQPIPTAVLTAAIRGDIDLLRLVRAELAARGVNLDGEWIGFQAARQMHLGDAPD